MHERVIDRIDYNDYKKPTSLEMRPQMLKESNFISQYI